MNHVLPFIVLYSLKWGLKILDFIGSINNIYPKGMTKCLLPEATPLSKPMLILQDQRKCVHAWTSVKLVSFAYSWQNFVMWSLCLAASLISPWILWWPPAESHYNIYDHSVVGYVSHAHSIVLLYSVGNKITTTTWDKLGWYIFANPKHTPPSKQGWYFTFKLVFRTKICCIF